MPLSAVQGFKAGIFVSPGVAVGSVPTYQLLANRSFDTGSITGWTSTCTGTGTAVVTAAKGWKEASYGLVLTDTGTTNSAGVKQVITLDTALDATTAARYRFVGSCWAKFPVTAKTAVLKVSLLSATDTVLGTATATLQSAHPNYGDLEWGYFSVHIQGINLTKKVQYDVYSDASVAQTVYIDNCSCVMLDQVAGAYGPMGMPMGHELQDITTFATAGTTGFRSFYPTLFKTGSMTCPAYYVLDELLGLELKNDTSVFVVLYSEKATMTEDRIEFWGKVSGVDYSAAPDKVQEAGITITATGLIGYANG